MGRSRRLDFITKEYLEECLDLCLTREQIAERACCSVGSIDIRMKEYGLKYLNAEYFNRGERNPAKNPNVRRKISNTVKTLWEDGFYSERIDGMKGKSEILHPNYSGMNHKYDFRGYLEKYQDISVCSNCGESNKKIDVHHVDENHDNWLITNLEPLCVKCHQKKHFKDLKTPYVTVGVKGHFDSCHNLLNYTGKCARVHGHRYVYEVKIRQRIDSKTGMVIDFKELKSKVKNSLEELLDHAYLNDILPFNTTAENMVVWIFEYLSKRELVKGIVEISLWETPECVVTINSKDMIQYYKDYYTDDFTIDELPPIGGD